MSSSLQASEFKVFLAALPGAPATDWAGTSCLILAVTGSAIAWSWQVLKQQHCRLAWSWQMIMRMDSRLTTSAFSRMKMVVGYGIGARGSSMRRSL